MSSRYYSLLTILNDCEQHIAITIVIDTLNNYECQYGFIQTRQLQETLWAPVSDILFLMLSHFGSNP